MNITPVGVKTYPQISFQGPYTTRTLINIGQAAAENNLRMMDRVCLRKRDLSTKLNKSITESAPATVRRFALNKLQELVTLRSINILKKAEGNNITAETVEKALKFIIPLGKNAKAAIPKMEILLNPEKFNALIKTKKVIYDAFNKIDPENMTYLESMARSASNAFEAPQCQKQFKDLDNLKEKSSENIGKMINGIMKEYKESISNKSGNVEEYVMKRLQLSRTASKAASKTPSLKEVQALTNYINGFNYFKNNFKVGKQPRMSDFVTLHKINTHNMPYGEYKNTQGLIRGIGSDPYKTNSFLVGFTKSEDVPKEFGQFTKWYNENYEKLDPFTLTAEVYQRLINIHPFYDGNGRTVRLFADWVLASKGQFMKQHPEEYLNAYKMSIEQVAEIIKNESVPVATALNK